MAKVEYAVKARRDDNFLVIARTGAVKNESFDAAVARGNLYSEAGADLVMLMPATDAQWSDAPKRIDAPAKPMEPLRNWPDWGRCMRSKIGLPSGIDERAQSAVARATGAG